jgi:1,4-alpha-glucan branching enzyme
VALVGDFNGWDARATPLARSADGSWTTTVSLAPGRHAYAYVIDDSAWVTDPRVPVTRDVDYGRDHSVVVVGAP